MKTLKSYIRLYWAYFRLNEQRFRFWLDKKIQFPFIILVAKYAKDGNWYTKMNTKERIMFYCLRSIWYWNHITKWKRKNIFPTHYDDTCLAIKINRFIIVIIERNTY